MPELARPPHARASSLFDKAGPWVDLSLTLPIFLIYQLGVVALEMHVRNGTDLLTGPLLQASEGNRALYLAITFAIGIVFTGVFALLGRGRGFRLSKLVQVIVEGVIFAVAMRAVAAAIVGKLFLGPQPLQDQGLDADQKIVLSCGAGFYEELAFRVILYGLVAKLLVWFFARQRVDVVGQQRTGLSFRAVTVMVLWAMVAAAVFSGIHYIGSLGDTFEPRSFVFRWVLGVALTLIYALRGFAAAVWTHALYDVWVMVL